LYEKILPDIYRIEVPLPKSPLKALNSYLVKGDGRYLLIDTGLNRKECKQALFSGLDELHVDLTKTDIFITHLHSDHMGLAGDVVRD
jgi:glyoxylase-like metal-dependent hydrolase (beta-lactamase superfamily II)